jgi:hypothetical protein
MNMLKMIERQRNEARGRDKVVIVRLREEVLEEGNENEVLIVVGREP